MEIQDFPLYATTFEWGRVESKQHIYATEMQSIQELRREAINRNIDIDDSPDLIYDAIRNQVPSIEWQMQNILDMSNRTIVSEEEFLMADSYGSYGFSTMNLYLRNLPDSKAPLNATIDKLTPLEKDIVVYRFVKKFDYLPRAKGSMFTSDGYLSTSICAAAISAAACGEGGAVMRIYVPHGKKCIYFPGREKELLFPHHIELELLVDVSHGFYCSSKGGFVLNDRIPVYDFIML